MIKSKCWDWLVLDFVGNLLSCHFYHFMYKQEGQFVSLARK